MIRPAFGVAPTDVGFLNLADEVTLKVLMRVAYHQGTNELVNAPHPALVLTLTEMYEAASAVAAYNRMVLRDLRPPYTPYPAAVDLKLKCQPNGDVSVDLLVGTQVLLNVRYRAAQNDVRFAAHAARTHDWSTWVVYSTTFILFAAQLGGPNIVALALSS